MLSLTLGAGSKYHFRLHPHAADATVGEIAIEELGHRRARNTLWRDLDKLRVIEGIQRFPPKFQASRLAKRNRLGQIQIEVVCPAGSERVTPYRRSIRRARSLHPMHVGGIHAGACIRILITGRTPGEDD